MQELADKGAASDLFRALDYDQVPRAVAAGVARGTLYADSPNRPRLALLWDGLSLLYLAGDPSHCEAAGLPGLMRDVLAQTRRAGGSGCLLHTAPRSWEWELGRLLPQGATASRFWRALYALPQQAGAERPRVPAPLRLEPVTESLLSRTDLDDREGLQEWLSSCWASPRHYLEDGFGYCLLRDELILSWCMAEYVTGGRCGIGVETRRDCRGQGFATLTARALAAEAEARGIAPYWDSWAGNGASLAVARKAGFLELGQYPVHWVPL